MSFQTFLKCKPKSKCLYLWVFVIEKGVVWWLSGITIYAPGTNRSMTSHWMGRMHAPPRDQENVTCGGCWEQSSFTFLRGDFTPRKTLTQPGSSWPSSFPFSPKAPSVLACGLSHHRLSQRRAWWREALRQSVSQCAWGTWETQIIKQELWR